MGSLAPINKAEEMDFGSKGNIHGMLSRKRFCLLSVVACTVSYNNSHGDLFI